MNKHLIVFLATCVIPVAAHSRDAWDQIGDETCSTSTAEMFHGSPAQLHDLEQLAGLWDVDFIWTRTDPGRSYEFRISGPAAGGMVVSLTDGAGNTQFNAISTHVNSYARTLSWREGLASGGVNCARVAATGSWGSVAQYTIEFRETTLYCPRYNNTGSQVSVLIIQDSRLNTSGTCELLSIFSTEAGLIAGSSLESMPSNGTRVVSLPSIPGVAGTKGSARIAHTCGVGGLTAKLVALEPATGFTFDTTCTPRQP